MPPNTEQNVATEATQRPIMDRADLETRVKQGEVLFVFEDKVYKVNRFLESHPGGEEAIRSVIGKDATDEIRSFHPARVYEHMIKPFCIADYMPDTLTDRRHSVHTSNTQANKESVPLKAEWGGRISVQAFDESLDELYAHHASDLSTDRERRHDHEIQTVRRAYRRLEQEIRDRGWFECNYYHYAKEICRASLLLYLSLWFCLRASETWHYHVSAGFMAFFWHQLVFSAHDAGHNGITGKVETDHLIGVIIANFIGGLSLGWWKHNHNVHHIVTNDPEHDPDIQHVPFMAVTTRFFDNLYSSFYKRVLVFDRPARFFIQYQHYLYYLILSFGRFNLHRLSFQYLLTAKHARMRALELIGIAVFFVWYGALLSSIPSPGMRVAYLFISYMLTFPLHVQITLSHFGMSTVDHGPDEPFPAKMLRTTMDVDCPSWFDWYHGGLQYQTLHHLFPRVPRHNLRMCLPLLRQFADETGLHYYTYNFSTGNGVVLGALKSVADQVGLMNDVAKHNAKVWAAEEQTES